jgi:hypothetical protein
VPPENCILNPASSRVGYDFNAPPYPSPLPTQTYDGEGDLERGDRSWGVVDDTRDAVIKVTLGAKTVAFKASARVFVGPPDYAPDRRFFSLAEDLADRDPVSLPKPTLDASPAEWHDAVTDLLRRISETTSLIDLERMRFRHLEVNQAILTDNPAENPPGFPAVDSNSMTPQDRILRPPLDHPLLTDGAAEAMRGAAETVPVAGRHAAL